MITDLFNATCTVYRLQGFADYDFTGSDEGEVEETWGIVAENVPCRLEREFLPSHRRTDGVVDTGQRDFYTGADVDIINADRIAASDNLFYTVIDVTNIYGMTNVLHHKEVKIGLIDWVPPGYTEIFIPSEGTTPGAGRGIDIESVPLTIESEFDIKEHDFTFETVSPVTLAIVINKERIKRVVIKIDTVFNDPATTLSVGHTGNVNGVMASTSNIPTFAGEYEVTPNIKYGGTDTIKFYINAGTSTQGAGTVFLETERND